MGWTLAAGKNDSTYHGRDLGRGNRNRVPCSSERDRVLSVVGVLARLRLRSLVLVGSRRLSAVAIHQSLAICFDSFFSYSGYAFTDCRRSRDASSWLPARGDSIDRQTRSGSSKG